MSERMLLFIPAYRCGPQIPRVLDKFIPAYRSVFDEILIIDNQSPDDTVPRAVAAAEALFARTNIPIKVLQNLENVSLGGTHKTAFNYALDHGFDYVSILHGDDQGDVADLVNAIQSGHHRSVDFYLGSRFLPQSKLVGYSAWRIWGNYVFNFLFSLATWRRLVDLGSGMNIFSTKALASRFYIKFPNRLTFNYYFILYSCMNNLRFAYFPHRWSEDDQVSNLKLVRVAKEMVTLLVGYVMNRKCLFASLPADTKPYQTKVLYASAPTS